MTVELHGYRPSVYRRVTRLALEEKAVRYTCVEVNPFQPPIPPAYLALHPFGRVPTLVHDGFVLYETAAITQYVDETFPGPALQPTSPHARARMRQIIAVIDSYGYWPMVRQVYVHGVRRSRSGEPADATTLRQGLDASARVLAALEALTEPAPFLCGDALSLADIHLAPMLAYFSLQPDAAAMLAGHPKLSACWASLSQRPAMITTEPGL